MKLWFDHFRREVDPGTFQGLLDDAIDVALATGQIKEHETHGTTAASHAAMFTTCKVQDKDGNVLATGYAFCTREMTPHNRKAINRIGRDIARGRAEKRSGAV